MSIIERDKISQEHASDEGSGTFNVQLFNSDGQLLSEYTLDPVKDNIVTLNAVGESARSDMVANDLGSTIIIVTQDILTNLRQVKITAGAGTS